MRRAFDERTPKRLLVGETRLLFQYIEELEVSLKLLAETVSHATRGSMERT